MKFSIKHFIGHGFKSPSGQPSIASSKNSSVVNTMCIIHSATLMRLPQENFN